MEFFFNFQCQNLFYFISSNRLPLFSRNYLLLVFVFQWNQLILEFCFDYILLNFNLNALHFHITKSDGLLLTWLVWHNWSLRWMYLYLIDTCLCVAGFSCYTLIVKYLMFSSNGLFVHFGIRISRPLTSFWMSRICNGNAILVDKCVRCIERL